MDITVINIGLVDREVGLRYLFDTYLGETDSRHFYTAEREEIDRELTLVGGQTEKYWISANESLGLQVMTDVQGVTVPDKVVFANWKRLDDAAWDYETSSARNFNLLPYSINDSAVAHYYSPVKLGPNERYTVTIVMGAANEAGFKTQPVTDVREVVEILEKVTVEQPGSERLAILADIQTLDDLIAQIDLQLDSGSLAEEDVPVMEQVIQELLKKYE
jgi:hypothetical protein